MKFRAALAAILFLSSWAQPAPQSQPKSATVPLTLDHNRLIINVSLSLPDGSTASIRGWVDNGTADLSLSRRVATLLHLNVTCDDKACFAPPPHEIAIGDMKISLAGVKQAKIPLKPVSAASVMAPGMSAEITLPATVLRNYDVLVNYPERKFTIGQPGSIHFRGESSKVQINSENGLLQVPSQIENKKYNLALDVGSSISFLSAELFEKLGTAHPDWPHMTGAIGPANMWGTEDEITRKLLRVDRVQYGPLFLTDLAVVAPRKEWMSFFEKRAGVATVGLLGANALLNYRVGIDYAHSVVYFDLGSTFRPPDFDVVGLILRPEDDGAFTILGVADFDGKPSVPEGQDGVLPGDRLIAVNGIPVRTSTMGQVWAMLKGQPGQERRLTIARGEKQSAVVAKVQHFLAESAGKIEPKEKSRRN
jgi:PDZ domain-containing protein